MEEKNAPKKMYQTHQEDQTEWGLLVLVKGLMGWGARGEAEGREGGFLLVYSLTHSLRCLLTHAL